MVLTEAQVDRIKSLEIEVGRITPQQVIDDAKKKDSPLHGLFEWDKSKAAYSFWLHRAREIIGAVTVVVTNERTTVKTPHYVKDPERPGYRSVATMREDPVQAKQSLIYTLDMASGHIRRALDLAGPLGMEGEIDALLEQIVGVQRIIRERAA